MNLAQRLLVENTLKWVGRVSCWLLAAMIAIGLLEAVGRQHSLWELVKSLVNPDEAGVVFWPLLVVGVVSLWVSAYFKAGRAE